MEAVMMVVVMMAMTRMRVWNLYDRYFCELRFCPFRARFSPRSEAAPAGGTAVKPAMARPTPPSAGHCEMRESLPWSS